MSKCILIEVIDREIYTELYDNVDKAWYALVERFRNFCAENECELEQDCNINYRYYNAWANGTFSCADWELKVIE